MSFSASNQTVIAFVECRPVKLIPEEATRQVKNNNNSVALQISP